MSKESIKKVNTRVTNMDILIGENLKRRRIELCITQKKLAITIGVSTQQLQKYEKITNRIPSVKLFYFAKSLKVPMNY